MKQAALGTLLAGASLQALGHDGHGVDPGAVLHHFSGAHLLLPASIVLSVGALYVGIRLLRNRL